MPHSLAERVLRSEAALLETPQSVSVTDPSLSRRLNLKSRPQITLEDAYRMAEQARHEAMRRKGEATIAIVDFSGALIYLERPDHQSPNSVEIATQKARTAAFRERPSSDLEARVKVNPGWLCFPNGLPMMGGVPLFYEGTCVGGIAVSGIALDDEPAAQAGADALAGTTATAKT
jgi:uncharacterized protein GlcG (DUF336 family)